MILIISKLPCQTARPVLFTVSCTGVGEENDYRHSTFTGVTVLREGRYDRDKSLLFFFVLNVCLINTLYRWVGVDKYYPPNYISPPPNQLCHWQSRNNRPGVQKFSFSDFNTFSLYSELNQRRNKGETKEHLSPTHMGIHMPEIASIFSYLDVIS